MFVGHYGVSFAAKAVERRIPLWLLFIAVQLVDVFWAAFVLIGLEKVRIVPGITATNPLDLYYMPYTHSLPAAILWSLAALLAYRFFPRLRAWGAAAIVGIAVFSHWLFDLLVHRPDLPLYNDTLKVGFGLWHYPVIAFGLEAALLAGGMYLYLRSTKALTTVGRYGPLVFGVLMLLIQASVFFGPPPPSDTAIALMGLLSYIAFAWVAYRLERKRA